MQVYRFLVRFYGDAGEKVDAAAAAYFGGRCVVSALVSAGFPVPASAPVEVFPCQIGLLALFRDFQRTSRCPCVAPLQACQPLFRRKGLSGKVEKARRHSGTIAKAGGIALVALAAYVLVRNARGSGRKGASIL